MGLLTLLVHNDAIKTDPKEIYGWRVYAVACAACFGAMLFGVETGIIGGVLTMEPFREDYGLVGEKGDVEKANLEANIVTTLQCGCFVGALAASQVADRLGRKTGLICAAVLAIIGTVMQLAASGNIGAIYAGRFVAGLGVGCASMVVPLYVSENAPRAIRGGLTGIYQLFIVSGIMLAFWINYGCVLHVSGKARYLVPLAMQGIPAIFMLAGLFFCNESPRWLAKQDRWEEASRVLAAVRHLPESHPYVLEEMGEIKEALDHERRLIGNAGFMDLQREMWTIPGNRKRALLSIGLMICQQMTGTNAINYYAPQIFESLGITGNTTGLLATGVYGIMKTAMCACFLLFAADSLGRRRSLLWTSVAMALSMLYVGLYVRIEPPKEGIPVPPAGYVALVCIYLFAGFFQWGWGPVCWIYVSEIPAARLRGLNVAFAAATQWLFNLVIARAVPNMLVTMGEGGYGTFILFACFCFAMGIFTWFFVPETKGLALERMDELFGVTEMSKHMDDEASVEGRNSKDGKSTHIEETSEVKN
ncbi:hypothetical protein D0864_06814 [Hortaea werneckii]|uniref:Major facilitator superfamily (MFS) profile domain-containing protein n=1 Tax=Hortaea werneckii TaxID=91943 RepID=A0A3M7FH84_HORWE|nr:general substrate transporter [Hortaea werneckii]KAI6862062.1 general substrate transporter [Hortaea werneckii]KAI7344973.1 general substrate transporter [Hortaea werneckii]RMY87634.1 hypothetical protein D0864_06814 [Hortaea werneckii]